MNDAALGKTDCGLILKASGSVTNGENSAKHVSFHLDELTSANGFVNSHAFS